MNKPNFNVTTSSEEVVPKKYRNFMLLLYPEWCNFNEILSDIKGSFKNYAYIKHKPDSDEKKEHVHLILALDNPREEGSLAHRLGIPENLCRRVKSLRGANRYLIHIDDEDKIQYSLEEVIVSKSYRSKYYKSFDDLLSDEEILDNIYTFVDSYKYLDPIDLEVELTKYVIANGFDTIFKRYYNSISKYITFKSQH